ncbi:hypothetical protein [Gillisia sp. JM1]|uniref:hypothetical protein n=1 Tax=Gillisia sp. JM1 TaxID=1283286 RepID=UPI00040A9AB5|nr:hypothetical protein [Gillisia sp. JM1]
MQKDLEDRLIEVRKAYRLLYDYQRRMLDLMGFIGGSFNREYEGGYPKFSNPSPNNGRGKLEQWSWDWLNMYYYEFHFSKKKVKTNTQYFAVFLVTDTGYYEIKKEVDIAKTKISAFETPEKSKSRLIFVVGENLWDPFGTNWSSPSFILGAEGRKGEVGNMMVYKGYALSKFGDQDSAIEQLRDFEEYCKKFNIDFKYQERKIK